LNKDFNTIADEVIVVQDQRNGELEQLEKARKRLDTENQYKSLKSNIEIYTQTLKDFDEEAKSLKGGASKPSQKACEP